MKSLWTKDNYTIVQYIGASLFGAMTLFLISLFSCKSSESRSGLSDESIDRRDRIRMILDARQKQQAVIDSFGPELGELMDYSTSEKDQKLYDFFKLSQPVSDSQDIASLSANVLHEHTRLLLKEELTAVEKETLQKYSSFLQNVRVHEVLKSSVPAQLDPADPMLRTLLFEAKMKANGFVPLSKNFPPPDSQSTRIWGRPSLGGTETQQNTLIENQGGIDELEVWHRILMHPEWEKVFKDISKSIDAFAKYQVFEYVTQGNPLTALVKWGRYPGKDEEMIESIRTELKQPFKTPPWLQVKEAVLQDLKGKVVDEIFEGVVAELTKRATGPESGLNYTAYLQLRSSIGAQYHSRERLQGKLGLFGQASIEPFKAEVLKSLRVGGGETEAAAVFTGGVKDAQGFKPQNDTNACFAFATVRDMQTLMIDQKKSLSPWYAYGLMTMDAQGLLGSLGSTSGSTAHLKNLKSRLGENTADWAKFLDVGLHVPTSLETLKNFGVTPDLVTANMKTNITLIENFIPDQITAEQTVKLKSYALQTFDYNLPDPEDLKSMFRLKIPLVALINTDRSTRYGNWARYEPGGYMSHAVRIVGFGTGSDLFDGEEKEFFIVEDSMHYDPYFIAQEELMIRLQGLMKVTAIQE